MEALKGSLLMPSLFSVLIFLSCLSSHGGLSVAAAKSKCYDSLPISISVSNTNGICESDDSPHCCIFGTPVSAGVQAEAVGHLKDERLPRDSPYLDEYKNRVFIAKEKLSGQVEFHHDNIKPKINESASNFSEPRVGRVPGDAVHFCIMEQYIEDLSRRYGRIFKELDEDMENSGLLLEQIRIELQSLQARMNIFVRDIEDLKSWRSVVSSHLEEISENNAVIRVKIEKLLEHQAGKENKRLVVSVNGLEIVFFVYIFRLACENVASLFSS